MPCSLPDTVHLAPALNVLVTSDGERDTAVRYLTQLAEWALHADNTEIAGILTAIAGPASVCCPSSGRPSSGPGSPGPGAPVLLHRTTTHSPSPGSQRTRCSAHPTGSSLPGMTPHAPPSGGHPRQHLRAPYGPRPPSPPPGAADRWNRHSVRANLPAAPCLVLLRIGSPAPEPLNPSEKSRSATHTPSDPRTPSTTPGRRLVPSVSPSLRLHRPGPVPPAGRRTA